MHEEVTSQELDWASRIKQAASDDPTINDAVISDLEYLHHAIVAKGKTAKARERIRSMQRLKERYGIQLDGSLEQAARDLQLFVTSHPHLLLSVATVPETGLGVICARYAALHVHRISSKESYCVLMRAMFYILQATQSKPVHMRAGTALLIGWRVRG
mmetsp:Transcript_6565/g.12623  ORF Transcript_6565/g.12623 Transcript_6565/m.12623 type:complete len:158 (+) Transcript_6565:91-564(+)